MRKCFAILLGMLLALPLQAAQVKVTNLRLWAAPDSTRLVFDTSEPVTHGLFSLKSPDRLVIDIANASLVGQLPAVGNNEVLSAIRSGQRNDNDLRVVLDLRGKVKAKSFVLKPNRQYGDRLVIDLEPISSQAAAAAPEPVKSVDSNPLRDVVVAIDAGHGGEDPGAIGAGRLQEKDVVLAIARQLARLVNAEKGMKAVLIRDGDYYLGLRKRIRLAREKRADLFVSIHADAFNDRRARGSSVFTLSNRSASSEAARWLANRENSADLVGGISLDDKDDVLARVLLDMSQSGTQEASHQVARNVLGGLKQVGKTHKPTVQQAGFAVLKSPDIPSILVETAFITNPGEARKLRDPRHQQRLAAAVRDGLVDYFRANAPPGTLMASSRPKRHIITRGETLSGIADQYQVTLGNLRQVNSLSGDRIQIGQVLKIPET